MTDQTESVRRAMIATGQPATDEREDTGQKWTTDEMLRDFEVLGFMAPFVVVRRRSDGVKGSLEFARVDGSRVYFGFTED